MKEQNNQLDKYKKETNYSIKQDFLNSLILGNNVYSLEHTLRKLDSINLSYLAKNQINMCAFKIDNYNDFLSQNNQKERSALRFAIVNIASEVAANYFSCEIFSQETDTFILIVNCEQVTDFYEFEAKLKLMLSEIQNNVKKCIQISLTITYSTLFTSLENLPNVYKQIKIAIQLKLRYGHGYIITPAMVDKTKDDDYQLSNKKMHLLIDNIVEGKCDVVLDMYKDITKQLFDHNYNVVTSCIIYLIYSICSTTSAKYQSLKDSLTLISKDYIVNLQAVEVSSDIDNLMEVFIKEICTQVNYIKNNSTQINNEFITQRIYEIVSKEYSNNALCLNFIAEKLGLSPNYIGHIFKASKNISIAQYIIDYRMDKLAYYINNSKLPLNTILDKVGLEKNNYFYTRFKKHFGVSLGEYKRSLTNTLEDE